MRLGAARRGAFTLVELMIVIAIIGIATAVLVVEMRGSFEDALLRANARKIIAACDAASNRAIAVHQAMVMRIDAAEGRFVVSPREENSDPSDRILGEWDSRVTVAVREPQKSAEEESASGAGDGNDVNTITFHPDGTADAREFLLRDREKVELLLILNPVTSRVRIQEMAVETSGTGMP